MFSSVLFLLVPFYFILQNNFLQSIIFSTSLLWLVSSTAANMWRGPQPGFGMPGLDRPLHG